ncbi:hypothetical protein [Lentzea sp.]|uniref:hypothetical protein n=1 Tax=Lentzea sp. TaxID=56099 RepID=UPI002ED391A9
MSDMPAKNGSKGQAQPSTSPPTAPGVKNFDGTTVPDDVKTGGIPGYYENKYPWPKTVAGDPGAGNGIKVSTVALKTFAQNLRMMLAPLTEIQQKMQGVKLSPGAFYDANELIMKVTGGGKGDAVQPATLAFVERSIQAITKTAEELEKLATAYATSEELNKATGRDLGEHMQSASDWLTKAIGAPVSPALGATGLPGVTTGLPATGNPAATGRA